MSDLNFWTYQMIDLDKTKACKLSNIFFRKNRRSYKLWRVQWVTKLLSNRIVFFNWSWTPSKDIETDVWATNRLVQFLINKIVNFDKPVLTCSRCKRNVHLSRDSRSLRLAGSKHLNVTINDRKGDCKVIFAMMDNLGLHNLLNGYQRSDRVPTPQRESLLSTNWAKPIERYRLHSLHWNIEVLSAYGLRQNQRHWSAAQVKGQSWRSCSRLLTGVGMIYLICKLPKWCLARIEVADYLHACGSVVLVVRTADEHEKHHVKIKI